ncbi:MAG: hypothetical protein UY35_C0027G0008 [Candidatus Saccharibacteria bacterium GW2011_GWC2_48_9]|nr:MAG: hypothetical protein UY35_C0027G0008 [Candidatus Saccharibacteria bacterium GW2011_GWC2_48_9]HCH34817.1 penicillin-binding protein [Candidatus Saccharibacteria bacterium]
MLLITLRKYSIGIAMLTLLFAPTSVAASRDYEQSDREIRDTLQRALDEYNIPSASLALTQGEHTTKINIGNTSNGTEVDSDTPFLIGSLSKSITALTIFILVQDDKLSLDTPIDTYLPEFNYNNPSSSPITIRHLLQQTSGIGALDGLDVTDRSYESSSPIQQATNRLSGVTLQAAPGERYVYTSANYLLLGSIIESVTNASYSDIVRAKVFSPLNMSRTSANTSDATQHGLVAGHQSWFGLPVKGSGFYDNSGAPYGYISSTTNDLVRFLSFMHDGGELLDKTHYALLKAIPTGDSTYINGWHYNKREGFFYHGGATPEFRAEMFYHPDSDTSGVILTNKYHSLEDGQVSNIMQSIRAIAAGKTPNAPPPQHHTTQWTLLALNLVIIGLFVRNVALYKNRPVRSKKFRFILGGALAATALGLSYALPHAFGAAWHSTLLFAPDVAYLSIVLIAAIILHAVLLFIPKLRSKHTI